MWIRCVIVILALITRLDGQPAGGKLMGGSESDLTAVYETGMKYFRGGGLRIDHNKAVEHFRQAAERGLPEAQAELALLYRSNGLFDFLNAADYQQATTWAERALQDGLREKANADTPSAQYELGQLYFSGLGVAKDNGKAREWYERAAANGNCDAKQALGFIYLSGQGVEKSVVTAKKYFEEAASANVAPAQLSLGVIYSSGDGIPKDYTKAAEWFRKAADQGSPSAQDALGVRYEKGQGVPQSFAKAAEYYQQAADRGFWLGIGHLARLYEEGNGVPKDRAKAAELYSKLAAQKHPQGEKDLKRPNATGGSPTIPLRPPR